MIGRRTLDHIVYAVADLDSACTQFEELLGVAPVFGGYHQTQGTKNALVGLGQGQYLELIAIDGTNKQISPPRWMGIDLLSKAQITRGAAKSDNLDHDVSVLREANPDMGNQSGGSRKSADGTLLSWELLLPLASPEVEIIPFMIDWSTAESHPSKQLSAECKLIDLCATHPNPSVIQPVLKALDITIDVQKSDNISIKAKISCPNGIVEI